MIFVMGSFRRSRLTGLVTRWRRSRSPTDATGRRDAGSSIASGRSRRHAPPTARKWRSTVSRSRFHDDQRANGVLGDERQLQQYIARLLGRLGPDGGVRVGSAQPLGKTQGVRLLREAERLARRLATRALRLRTIEPVACTASGTATGGRPWTTEAIGRGAC
jgi:hypothetical protein